MKEGIYLLERSGIIVESQIFIKILDRWFTIVFDELADVTGFRIEKTDSHYNLTYIGDI